MIFIFRFDYSEKNFLKVLSCAWWKPQRRTNEECVNQAQDLPPEIWEKIFLKLPMKSLGKCISVCKVWKSIITDKSFILAHFSYKSPARASKKSNDSLFLQYQFLTNPNHFMFFNLPVEQKTRSDQYLSVLSDDKEASCLATITSSLDYPTSDLEIVGTCNGLVCFVKYSESLGFNQVIIMNLSIRRYITLPNASAGLNHPWERVLSYGFGFDPKINDFKVVMIVIILSKKPRIRVDVYSLPTGWRSIVHGVPSICYCSIFEGPFERRRMRFVNGSLHWLVCNKCSKKHHRSFIATFDLSDETFGEIMLPGFWDEGSCFDPCLLVRGNHLALAYQKRLQWNDEIRYDVCVMKEHGVVDSWNRVFSHNLRAYPDIERVIGLRSSEEMVIQTSDHKIILLHDDLKKKKKRDLKLRKYSVGFVADHAESLFLIDQEINNFYVNNRDTLDVSFV